MSRVNLSDAVLVIDDAIAALRAPIRPAAAKCTETADKLGRIRDHLRSKECAIANSKGRFIDRSDLSAAMTADQRRGR